MSQTDKTSARGSVIESLVVPSLVLCVPTLRLLLGVRQGLLCCRIGVERPHQPIHRTLVGIILDRAGGHVEPVRHGKPPCKSTERTLLRLHSMSVSYTHLRAHETDSYL